MASAGQTAYVTGGASGLGKATAEMLVRKGVKVFLVDINESGAQAVCESLNSTSKTPLIAQSCKVDVSDWNSQAKAFTQAVTALGGRIDHVYAIAGIAERPWLPLETSDTGFERPDLSVLDVNLKGVLYTVSLAVQQFRRQGLGHNGFAGKVGILISVCGLYAIPTIPIYTTAKHGLTGFVRSYGEYLMNEKIMLNGVCPNVVRTQISTPQFYDMLEAKGLLTSADAVPETFEALLDGELATVSGETYELGPNYGKDGQKWVRIVEPEAIDEASKELFRFIKERSVRPAPKPVSSEE